MASEGPKHSYVPNQDELSDAISAVLKESSHVKEPPSAKDVQKVLCKENPTWKIPERRVAKFLKKQHKEHTDQPQSSEHDVDDHSMSSTSSAASKLRRLSKMTGGSVKNIVTGKKGVSGFFRRKKKGSSEEPSEEITIESPPSAEQDSNLLPPMDADENEEDISPMASPKSVPQATEEVPAPAAEDKEEEQQTQVVEEGSDGKEVEAEEKAKDATIEDTVVRERGNIIYEDDNDGKKEEGPCAGCVIL